jgi:uncharacterized protein
MTTADRDGVASAIASAPDGVRLSVRVVPRAGRAGLAGTRSGAVLVRLHAAPVDGAANAELIAFLANLFRVPKRSITIVAGDRSRRKQVHVIGLDASTAAARLQNP